MTPAPKQTAKASEVPKAPAKVPDYASMNVYQKFVHAARIIGTQAWVRDMSNSQYKSIPIDRMRGGVREACATVGLVHVGPVDIEVERTQNERMIRFYGSARFEYIDADHPEQKIVFETLGEAMDAGDKGVGKFITNLIKNHYKAAFDIGEQNADDVDTYSNDDFYRYLEEQEKKASQPKQNTKASGFYAPKVTVAKLPAKPAEAPAKTDDHKTEDHKDVVTDRPREVMVQTVMKANHKVATRQIVTRYSDRFGIDPNLWTDQAVADCYAEICDTMREADE